MPLSPREREILPLLVARWTDREIAEELCISYRTVTTHVAHILDKLGLDSRRAVARALGAGRPAFAFGGDAIRSGDPAPAR